MFFRQPQACNNFHYLNSKGKPKFNDFNDEVEFS